MKKILLLTDFSEASKRAIRFAQVLFYDTAAEFDLLHAYPLLPDVMYETAPLQEESVLAAQENLQKVLSELTDQPTPAYHTYRTLTAPGDPVEAVTRALTHRAYDYVVVGATGAGFLPVLGSVATGLIRHAKAHVLVVPSSATGRPVRDVTLALDYGSFTQLEKLQPLQELIDRKKARLTALTIVDNHTPVLLGQDFEWYSQQLRRALATVEVEPHFILDEKVEHGIESYLSTHAVDLLVTVPRRKSLLDALWNRSLTRQLAYKPRVPLLALYAPDPQVHEALINQGNEYLIQ
ncbi:hypothetical protein GCM10027275_15060 [Rhabdobacter roseus]|uniref:Nucleotide-binding universal stress UspA family protein n=1 Tax=Rhabdobacter roseus TaxID=1655419 RepID=A0A840TH03_9BACT|nr:universal stress protein [Rhabdobacter roseus]MBB5283426.1 nucleotide-binding universal stress UspA family protein [Rhabdobacter roseus]